MNTLGLYYSYIIHPYKSVQTDNVVLVSHPPIFVIKVHNSIHVITSEYVSLFFFIPQYYFIIPEKTLFRKYTFVETNARGPPIGVNYYGY